MRGRKGQRMGRERESERERERNCVHREGRSEKAKE